MGLTVRCRQCGATQQVAAERLPRYGARVRCGECGTLLPPITPAPAEEGDRDLWGPLEQFGTARTGAENPPLPEDLVSRPTRAEAREILRLWMREVSRDRTEVLTEERLMREHGAELARLFSLWRASYPGAEGVRVFRAELQAILENLAHEPGD